ncbi:Uncharacterized protein dnm_093580 [Desulfonema magnum]|uniref:Uncharacterized protein n=1 Tax=Desulfonema magnum TaxID=45655 RepID=A0A975BXB6_9BACT|nr:Uncharacterized protein dnm_093580 [Desulfonema magnum]
MCLRGITGCTSRKLEFDNTIFFRLFLNILGIKEIFKFK